MADINATNPLMVKITDDHGDLRKLDDVIHEALLKAYVHCGCNATETAKQTFIGRSTLYRIIGDDLK